MSYVALVTDHYDALIEFYGGQLGFKVESLWERPGARGCRFKHDGLRLEILDNQREKEPINLNPPSEKIQVVVEVDNLSALQQALGLAAAQLQSTSWGALTLALRDPDGLPVTLIQWSDKRSSDL